METTVLLSVGELNENKNHQIVIKALAQLKNENIYYIICGQGKLKTQLEELIKKLKLEKRVILAGYRKDINQFYQMADIFVFPSLREGLGLSAIEAMSAGLPLITSNIHGINDYSMDGVTGFKCNRYDVTGYVDAIKKLCFEKKKEFNVFDIKKQNRLKVKKYDIANINAYMDKIYNQM